MSYVAHPPRSHDATPARPRLARTRVEDHDLPVLAAGEPLPRAPHWDALMAKGVEPAVFLGAERRLSGQR